MHPRTRRFARQVVPESFLRWRWERRKRYLFGDQDYPQVFEKVYRTNYWGNGESRSGGGSTEAATNAIRKELETWLERHSSASFVDLPCGDMNWMSRVRFPVGMTYLGIDIVEEMIEANKQNHAVEGRAFEVGDIIAGPVPEAEVYFCRDLFIHFPNEAIRASIVNVRECGAKWLMATTYPSVDTMVDTTFPRSRRVNMDLFLGEATELLDDSSPGVEDRYMGVYKLL